jgi:hypothetical protein
VPYLISYTVEHKQFREKFGFVAGETLGKELAEDASLLLENVPQVNERGVAVCFGPRFWGCLLRKGAVFCERSQEFLSVTKYQAHTAFQLSLDAGAHECL